MVPFLLLFYWFLDIKEVDWCDWGGKGEALLLCNGVRVVQNIWYILSTETYNIIKIGRFKYDARYEKIKNLKLLQGLLWYIYNCIYIVSSLCQIAWFVRPMVLYILIKMHQYIGFIRIYSTNLFKYTLDNKHYIIIHLPVIILGLQPDIYWYLPVAENSTETPLLLLR